MQIMASKIAEKAPGWFTRLLLPQISEMKAELKVLNGRIDSLETKMNAEFKIVHAEIEGVNEKVEALDKRLDVVQRLAVLEAKLREYENRKP
jgi:hypothetical protein